MESRNDQPPTHTIQPIDPPPPSDSPTTAQLKGDIDSGRTGDKVEVSDPGLSPLGTDDEAAGTPAEPHRVRLARRLEGAQRWAKNASRAAYAHRHTNAPAMVFGAFAVVAGLVMAGGIVWGKTW